MAQLSWQSLPEGPIGGSHNWYNTQPWAYVECKRHLEAVAPPGRRVMRAWNWHNPITHGRRGYQPWGVGGGRNDHYFRWMEHVCDEAKDAETLVLWSMFQHHDFPLNSAVYGQGGWGLQDVNRRYEKLWQFQRDCVDWHVELVKDMPHVMLEVGNEVDVEWQGLVVDHIRRDHGVSKLVSVNQTTRIPMPPSRLREVTGAFLPFANANEHTRMPQHSIAGYDTDHDGDALHSRTGTVIANAFFNAAKNDYKVLLQMHPISNALRLEGHNAPWNDPDNLSILAGTVRLSALLNGTLPDPITPPGDDDDTRAPARQKAFVEMVRFIGRSSLSNTNLIKTDEFQRRWSHLWRR